MTPDKLPPLPPPNYPAERDYSDAWTDDQMRAYAAIAYAAGAEAMREAAAGRVDQIRAHGLEQHSPKSALEYAMGAIRALSIPKAVK